MVLSLFRRLTASRSDRRLEPRGTQVDGFISLGGRDYPLKDWSRRGFSAVGFAAEHYPGDKLTLHVTLMLPGEDPGGADTAPLTFDCTAMVVWVDRERREVAGVFTDLDLRIQEKVIRALFNRRDQSQTLVAALHG